MDSPSSNPNTPIRFYVPTSVLEAAHDWQNQHGVILTLPMPTDTEPWDGDAEAAPDTYVITECKEPHD